MKIIKKVLNIFLIFSILQILGIVFVSNNIYAGDDSFMQKVEHTGKSWKELVTNDPLDWNNGKDDETMMVVEGLYNTVKYLGVGIFMVSFTITMIGISMKANAPEVIAENKTKIIIICVLGLLFIFAKPIVEFIQTILEQFEGLMG